MALCRDCKKVNASYTLGETPIQKQNSGKEISYKFSEAGIQKTSQISKSQYRRETV